jgi:hypothetical protein
MPDFRVAGYSPHGSTALGVGALVAALAANHECVVDLPAVFNDILDEVSRVLRREKFGWPALEIDRALKSHVSQSASNQSSA